jgi:DNA polymerase I-like protein with 3'-5' exonuclease and polymerase domains
MAKDWGKSWSYTPAYESVGLVKVSKRIGFKVNTTVLTHENFDQWMDLISQADYAAFDTETRDKDYKPTLRFDEAYMVMLVISIPVNQNLVCIWDKSLVKPETQSLLPDHEDIQKLLLKALECKVVFTWNRLFDQRVLLNSIQNEHNWLRPENFFTVVDAMGMLWALDTNVKFGLGLKLFGTDYLGIEMSAFEDSVTEDWRSTDMKQAAIYTARDGYVTLAGGMMLYRICQEHAPFWLTLDRQLQSALYYLERESFLTALEPLQQLEQVVAGKLEKITDSFYTSYGKINLGSSAQKSQLLQSLGYTTGVYSEKTGAMSVAKDALAGLAVAGCEPAKLMLDFNKHKTLLNNFITKIIHHLESGVPARFHLFTYRVPTLRLAAGAYKISKKKDGYYDYFIPVNSQALAKPAHIYRELNFNLKTKEVQFLDEGQGEYYTEAGSKDLNCRCWIGNAPGRTILETDYHALEIVIPTNLSLEPVWVNALKNKEDPHRATASLVFGKPVKDITPNERQLSKKLNFGIMYAFFDPSDYNGIIYTAVNRCHVPQEIAVEIVPRYIAALPTLFNWKLQMYSEAVRTGIIKNIWGFEYRLGSYIKSGIPKIIKYGKKLAISDLGQGTGGVFARMSLVKLAKQLYYPNAPWRNRTVENMVTGKLEPAVTYVNQVHDSIVTSVANQVLDEWIPIQIACMESCTPKGWTIPLEADPSIGGNWGEVFPVCKNEDGVYIPVSEPEKRGTMGPVLVSEDDGLFDDEDEDSDDFDSEY